MRSALDVTPPQQAGLLRRRRRAEPGGGGLAAAACAASACLGLAGACALASYVLSPTVAPLPGPDTSGKDTPITTTSTLPQTTTEPLLDVQWLGPPARLWQTSQNDGELLSQKADVLLLPDFDFVGPVVDVSQVTGQHIVGFGGAFTEASALVYKGLSTERQEELLQAYFGPDGIGYTLGRVHINSCDFSRGSYSLDDHDGDFSLRHFDSNASRDSEALIPFILAAQSLLKSQGKRLRLLASPWSPPAWMKTTGAMDHSGTPCLRKEAHRTWAEYISRWIETFNAKGVRIWAITVQNEPERNATWEACIFTPQEEAKFLGGHLGPVLRYAHPEVLIFVYDHNKDHLYEWTKAIYSHKEAAKFADGIAFHWYSGDDFDNVRRIHGEYPKALLLASEATYERWRWKKDTLPPLGEWSFGEGYAHDIIGDLNAGSIGWIDWNLLLNEHGGPNHVDNVCDAAVMANLTNGRTYRHPQYYFIGHFSKFVSPGSQLLETMVGPTLTYRGKPRSYGTCGVNDGLQATAVLRPDGLVATVVLNCGEDLVKFKIREGSRAMHTSIPPHAIQTYVFEQKGSSPLQVRTPGSGDGSNDWAPFIGVNLGGWLLLEDWMWAEEMRLKGIPDEYTLTKLNGGPQDKRAISLIQAHRETFVSERDLDRLQAFGVSHVRVPIGYWLVDYDPADGFVDGSERYLFRLLCWLQRRGMRAVIDLHALPGAQVAHQSFTGRKSTTAGFFTSEANYERGKRAMVRLAELVLRYEAEAATAGVVLGVELVNEPDWAYWNAPNGIRTLYETMVPVLRRLLPAKRYLLFLSFMEMPRFEGSQWLAAMRVLDPANFEGVVYDAHVYHAYGDDGQQPGHAYVAEPGGEDACKTCCRDPLALTPVTEAKLPVVIGEYSLNTGFPGNPDFYYDFMRNQLSLWGNMPGIIGSFFWNHRVLREPGGWFLEMSLLELLAPHGPLPPVARMNVSVLCPGEDLSRCPHYNVATMQGSGPCRWRPQRNHADHHQNHEDEV